MPSCQPAEILTNGNVAKAVDGRSGLCMCAASYRVEQVFDILWHAVMPFSKSSSTTLYSLVERKSEAECENKRPVEV